MAAQPQPQSAPEKWSTLHQQVRFSSDLIDAANASQSHRRSVEASTQPYSAARDEELQAIGAHGEGLTGSTALRDAALAARQAELARMASCVALEEASRKHQRDASQRAEEARLACLAADKAAEEVARAQRMSLKGHGQWLQTRAKASSPSHASAAVCDCRLST